MSKQKPTEYIIINGTSVQRITTTHPGGVDFVTAQYRGSTVIQSDGAALSSLATAPDGYRIDDASDRFVALTEPELIASGALTIAEYNDRQSARRRAAYSAQTDPMFFDVQRGEATIEQWQAACEAVRAQYPYMTDVEA